MLAAHVHSTAWASYSILQPHTTQNVHYIAGFSRRTVVIERMIRRRLCVATSALLPFHSNHTGEKTRTSSTEYTYWPSPLSAMQSKTILVECELIWLHSHHVFFIFHELISALNSTFFWHSCGFAEFSNYRYSSSENYEFSNGIVMRNLILFHTTVDFDMHMRERPFFNLNWTTQTTSLNGNHII